MRKTDVFKVKKAICFLLVLDIIFMPRDPPTVNLDDWFIGELDSPKKACRLLRGGLMMERPIKQQSYSKLGGAF